MDEMQRQLHERKHNNRTTQADMSRRTKRAIPHSGNIRKKRSRGTRKRPHARPTPTQTTRKRSETTQTGTTRRTPQRTRQTSHTGTTKRRSVRPTQPTGQKSHTGTTERGTHPTPKETTKTETGDQGEIHRDQRRQIRKKPSTGQLRRLV